MNKVIRSSTVGVLILASSSFAGLIHDQATAIHLTNAVDLLHGSQQASSLQNLVVNNEQNAEGTAVQTFFGSLGQVGNTQGNCALIGLDQVLSIAGTQSQNVGDNCDPKAQLQNLSFGTGQSLAKADGEGAANAVHTIVLNAGQTADNAAGNLTEEQTVMGMQTSNLTGQTGATGLVNGTMAVTTAQTQGSL
jgi:hypothetical protein